MVHEAEGKAVVQCKPGLGGGVMVEKCGEFGASGLGALVVRYQL